ncbi:choice-of-anchor Q domain-containing protein [Bacteroidota bacterium]
MYASGGNLTILNNSICNNTAGFGGGGFYIYQSDPEFANNIICNNEAGMGGGVYFSSTQCVCTNNTISFNKASSGGGLEIGQQANPELYNNIIWGNEPKQVSMTEINPVINFYYNNIQDGKEEFQLEVGSIYFGEFLNNIDTIPGFQSPPAGAGFAYPGFGADWSLLASSPCINKGSKTIAASFLPEIDYDNNKRIAYSEIDIGAYEFNLPTMDASCSIGQNLTWTADTIKVNCDITIQDSYTLTINPGALVQFQGPYKIEVEGTLLALGTETDSIVFTVRDTTGFADLTTDNGGWKGIEFDPIATNDSSMIYYSRFEYGKRIDDSGGIFTSGGGAIFVSNCFRLLISNSTITNSMALAGGGIFLYFSPIRIQHSTINHNRSLESSGGGIFLRSSHASINGCIISHNECAQDAGGIFVYNCKPLIENCTISYNSTEHFGGGIYAYLDSRPVLSGNVISYNSGEEGGGLWLFSPAYLNDNLISNNHALKGGGLVNQSDKPITLINNIICNNTAENSDGAILIRSDNAKLINNTIVNNYAGQDNGGITLSIGATVMNTIVWGNNTPNDSKQIFTNLAVHPDISFSNIQGGLQSMGYSDPSYYPGIYESNLDSLPGFNHPTIGPGNGYDGTMAEWTILATSPAVNAGNPDTQDYEVLSSDFYDNTRIHLSLIDIGAAENQSGIPIIEEHPLNFSRCIGDSVEFSVKVTNDAFYQWQLNQVNIPGANQNSFNIDSIRSDHEGNYQCIIRNGYGTIKSNPSLLQVKLPPVILSQPEHTWAELNARSNFKIFAHGTNPEYQWRLDGTELEGQILNELSIPETGYQHEGLYDCIISNVCGSDTTNSANLYLVPQICMVTVSQTTGYNLVVWEKESKSTVLAYNIYRESEAAGIYDILTTVSYDDLSVFVDTMADPTVQAYLYKITAIDTAEKETDIDLCKPHKTIHLLVTTNPELNTTQLAWDRYYGFDYQTYTIYRSSTGLNFDPVHSMSASLNSWTDPNPSTGDLFYRIAVEKPVPCTAEESGKKAGTGPFYHSLSNMDDNKLQAGQLPPDTITLSNNSIEEEKLPATVIGKLLTEDPDTIDSHSYQFVPGEGDDDNIRFTLLGDLLLASESFDYESKSQYLIRIRSTDQAGGFCEVPFIIQITDVDETTGLPVLNSSAVKAFPNPFLTETIITFPNPSAEPYRMLLMDLSGKVIRIKENITSGKVLLKRGSLGKGMYIIELKGEKTYRGKLVIE